MTQESVLTQDIVYCLSAVPDDNQLWLAAKQSGLQQSHDGGQTWQQVFLNPANETQPTVTGITIAPGPDETSHFMVATIDGVSISKDGCATWTTAALALPRPFITALVASPDYANDGIAFAATLEDGVFRTEDYGVTWRQWGFGLFDFHVMGLAVSPNFSLDGMVFAVTESGIYRSRTGGRSWQVTSFPPEAAPVLCIAISPDFSQDNRLYAGTERSGLYYSEDGGQSWQRTTQPAATDSINAILLDSRHRILVMTDQDLWISENAGEPWSKRNTETDFGPSLTAALAPQGLAAGNPLLLGLADGRILTIT